jgi:hypothetical protein
MQPSARPRSRGFRKDIDMTRSFMRANPLARTRVAAIAIGVLVGLCGQASANGVEPVAALGTSGTLMGSQTPTAGQSFLTFGGPAFITGQTGSFATTTLPGSAGQGLLFNNGNGTSTLVMPGGVPQTVPTAR